MIEAILFDMDGVLIDARDWHYEALNKALVKFGMSIRRDDHLYTFDGLPTRKKLEILSNSRGLPRGLHEFLNDLKQQYTLELTVSLCKPVFHIQHALARLHADKYRMAVCSNSVRNSVETMMRLSALEPYLELMLSNEDVKHSKPHPEIYTTAMEKLGVSPERTLILEDNENGIRAARASGAHVMEVSSPADVTYAAIVEVLQPLSPAKQGAKS